MANLFDVKLEYPAEGGGGPVKDLSPDDHSQWAAINPEAGVGASALSTAASGSGSGLRSSPSAPRQRSTSGGAAVCKCCCKALQPGFSMSSGEAREEIASCRLCRALQLILGSELSSMDGNAGTPPHGSASWKFLVSCVASLVQGGTAVTVSSLHAKAVAYASAMTMMANSGFTGNDDCQALGPRLDEILKSLHGRAERAANGEDPVTAAAETAAAICLRGADGGAATTPMQPMQPPRGVEVGNDAAQADSRGSEVTINRSRLALSTNEMLPVTDVSINNNVKLGGGQTGQSLARSRSTVCRYAEKVADIGWYQCFKRDTLKAAGERRDIDPNSCLFFFW